VNPVDLGAPSDLIGAHELMSIEAVLAAPNGYACVLHELPRHSA
jgi:hypothetical protein